jgi:hypothetical protein
MKKLIYGTLVVSTLALTGCVKVNFNEFYAKGCYLLKGYVYVTEGATITFEAGSVIKSDVTQKGALIIERGAKLIAQGTKDLPIVFTSGKAIGQRAPGDWGGIILLGKAPTNRPLDPAPTIEGVWAVNMVVLTH